jgi:hypothetical protein
MTTIEEIVKMWDGDEKHLGMETMLPKKKHCLLGSDKVRTTKKEYPKEYLIARIRLLIGYNVFYEFKVYPKKHFSISLCNDVNDKCKYSSREYKDDLLKLMKKFESSGQGKLHKKYRLKTTGTKTVALKSENIDLSNIEAKDVCDLMEYLINKTLKKVLKILIKYV